MSRNLSKPISCFLFGYGGANNTGADVRILTIIDDFREALGPDTRITIGTLNASKTARIIPQGDGIEIEQIPYIFPLAGFRLVTRHDITFLVEGSKSSRIGVRFCFTPSSGEPGAPGFWAENASRTPSRWAS